MAEAFISYSRVDKEFVRRLGAALEAGGRDAWVDLDASLRPPTGGTRLQLPSN